MILRNYKSIGSCDVPLGLITFLVGPNGSGRSNFVEALRFLSYGLSISLEAALDNRSGFRSIVHRGAEIDDVVSIRVFFNLDDGRVGDYLVEIGAVQDGAPIVTKEECSVRSPERYDWFKVRNGVVESNQGLMPSASLEKLYLVNASGLVGFEAVYRALQTCLFTTRYQTKSEVQIRKVDRALESKCSQFG